MNLPDESVGAEHKKCLTMLVISMMIFGTIGLFRKFIDLPSSFLAMARGIIGSLFLIIFLVCRKAAKRSEHVLDITAIRPNLWLLFLSGAMIGFNWILLFEAYKYTSIATATLCYYMAPVFVILMSPVFIKEKLTLRKIICVIVALVGEGLVCGVGGSDLSLAGNGLGIVLGLGAALLYAFVIITNQKITNIGSYDRTVMQLSSAAIVLIPYVLLTEKGYSDNFDAKTIILVIFVGIVHTGIAYALYFGSMSALKSSTVALFGYLDPVCAIVLSAILLGEPLGLAGVIGAIMILSAAAVSELKTEEA